MDETEAGRGLGAGNKSLPSSGEVDFKTKAGTAWSHSFLNQKPWHPLSYPNQRRKWIAEQTHAQKQRRAEEVAREYAQEQEFLRQAALLSKKEQEKLEMMKAVSFLYVKPPGYNAESAKAAEVADVKRKQADEKNLQEPSPDSSSVKVDNRLPEEEKKKPRPKDVFGRALPTEEQFEVLKNAPRLETGVAGRAKPFGVEIRNVKCLRCGNFGHQSGDRECPLKDAIMPNEESRLKRDDPLTAILAQTDPTEPLKWELKQKPGMSPPRGGFDPDDPNQQIVAEDIFDEYGGFLGEVNIPELLTDFSKTKTKIKTKTKTKKRKSNKSSKHRRRSPSTDIRDDETSGPSSGDDRGRWQEKTRHKRKKQRHSESDSSESSDRSRHRKRESRHHKQHYPSSSEGSGPDERVRSHRDRHHHSHRDRHQHPRQDGRHIPHRDGHRHHHSVPSSD